MQIRPANPQDCDRVRDIYRAAFPAEEWETVARVAVDLLAEPTSPATFAWMAEVDGRAVGHVAFSPVADRETGRLIGYILAPLAVKPAFQKRGVGTALIEHGLAHLSELGVEIVFVYGDPQYYGRFGFDAGVAAGFASPYPLQYEFGWQARRLTGMDGGPSAGPLRCAGPLMNPALW